MAKPRVFVSSTFYDLKHIRSSLDIFIESLGFEPILSEKGDIAYSPDHPLDESCYREVQTADIFVLIIGCGQSELAGPRLTLPAVRRALQRFLLSACHLDCPYCRALAHR